MNNPQSVLDQEEVPKGTRSSEARPGIVHSYKSVNNPQSVLDQEELPKGTRHSEARPGSMTVFIRLERLP
ncbi:MAG: hypothetical protein HY268_05780 [Deltaproteobacteria bacterium]|nr:hypothetical protein [Deltaproteobacteria bacterium]